MTYSVWLSMESNCLGTFFWLLPKNLLQHGKLLIGLAAKARVAVIYKKQHMAFCALFTESALGWLVLLSQMSGSMCVGGMTLNKNIYVIGISLFSVCRMYDFLSCNGIWLQQVIQEKLEGRSQKIRRNLEAQITEVLYSSHIFVHKDNIIPVF